MKNLLFLLPLLLLFACGMQEEQSKVSKVVIQGSIENPKGEEVYIQEGEDKYTATLDSTGAFILEVPLEEPGFHSFHHGSERAGIFLSPGMDLTLSLNTDEFDETLQFEGEGSSMNNYLMAKYLLNEGLWDDYQAIFTLEEEAYIQRADSASGLLKALLEKWHSSHPDWNAEFLELERTAITFEGANKRMMYLVYHPYMSGNKEYEPSEAYLSFMDSLDLNNAYVMQTSVGKSYVRELLNHRARKYLAENDSLKEADNGWGMAKLEVLSDLSENQAVLDYAYFTFLEEQLYTHGADVPEPFLAAFRINCSDENYRAEVEEKLEKWQTLAKGSPAPGFQYVNIDGEEVSLEDLKGKYVYVDVWATWCGPCLGELPHLEGLQEKYAKNEDIAFVSISIDDNKRAWEKMVTEKEMKGIQLYAKEAWDSQLCKDYLIEGIPRFILIQPDGTLYSAKAPRPSTDKIKEILEEIDTEGMLSSI